MTDQQLQYVITGEQSGCKHKLWERPGHITLIATGSSVSQCCPNFTFA